MSFFGRASRHFIEDAIRSGSLSDTQIVECDLEGLRVNTSQWSKVDIHEAFMNNAVLSKIDLTDCHFGRLGMTGTVFDNCTYYSTILDGISLIKTKWINCKIYSSDLKNSTFQRAIISKTMFSRCKITEFEAMYANFENCIFHNCTFSISYASGMNGFADTTLINCIFYNCSFFGLPLRGAFVKNTVFSACYGEIADDIKSENSTGLPSFQHGKGIKLSNNIAARDLLSRYTTGAIT